MSIELTRGQTFTHPAYAGVAVSFREHPRIADDTCALCEYGEHDDEDACRDYDLAVVRMVGDDHDFTVGVADLVPLDEDGYCGGCGQTGCHADRREA